MNNANTVDGAELLFSVFHLFPILKVLLTAFFVYLLVRSVFTYRSALSILYGHHYLEGVLVYHGDAIDSKGRKFLNTSIKVGGEFYEFGTGKSEYGRLPNYKQGDPVRIYFAPSMPGIKFLWIPTRNELISNIFSKYVFRPLIAFLLAVIAFWLFPLMFLI